MNHTCNNQYKTPCPTCFNVTACYPENAKLPDIVSTPHVERKPHTDPQIDDLYQYLTQVHTYLEIAIQNETDNSYKLHLIGRLYELQHVLYIIDEPESIAWRIENTISLNTM
jgi:hypothetical protein